MSKPLNGMVADVNDWDDPADFRSTCRFWKYRMGIEHVLLLSGSSTQLGDLLSVAQSEGIGVVCGGMAELSPFLDGTLPDTQLQADDVVEPIADILFDYPSPVEGVLVGDDATVEQISRIAKLTNAFHRLLPGVPVVAAQIGLNRAGPIQRSTGLDALLLQTYCLDVDAPYGVMRMNAYGYDGVTPQDYVRQVQSEAGQDETTCQPLWVIGQIHNFTTVSPGPWNLRTPTPYEIRLQYDAAWELRAERVYWFIWRDRDEVDHSWTGLESLPELQQAIAELDGFLGVPSLDIDTTLTATEHWDAHPFNPESPTYRSKILPTWDADEVEVSSSGDLLAAINAAPAEGRVIFLEGPHTVGTAAAPAIVLKSHIFIRGVPDTDARIVGPMRVLPCVEANNYGEWMTALRWNDTLTSLGVMPLEVFRSHQVRDWHIKGITFDGDGAIQNLTTSTARDIVLEDCDMTRIVGTSNHIGHWNANAKLENIGTITCRFWGNGDLVNPALRPQFPSYFDGAHGAFHVNPWYASGAFSSSAMPLEITNDDANADYNANGVIDLPEQRMAQYCVNYGASVGDTNSLASFTGRNCLLDHCTQRDGTTIGPEGLFADSRPAKRFPTFTYQFTGNTVRRAHLKNVGPTFGLIVTRGQTETGYPNPVVGQNKVIDCIVERTGFDRWHVHTGVESVKVGPDEVINSGTSGTIPPSLPWSPSLYPYLPPVPIPPTPLELALARIAELEAEKSVLLADRTTLLAWQASARSHYTSLVSLLGGS